MARQLQCNLQSPSPFPPAVVAESILRHSRHRGRRRTGSRGSGISRAAATGFAFLLLLTVVVAGLRSISPDSRSSANPSEGLSSASQTLGFLDALSNRNHAHN